MTTVETSIDIAQPPEIIAEAFLDPANDVYWTTDLERFETVSRTPGDVGAVAHLHYFKDGHAYIMDNVLEAI